MNNLVLITSVINTPNMPLSYTNMRSVYSRQERFQQTILTIESVRKFIPNSIIILIDCTDFLPEEYNYLKENVDYLINLWNNNDVKNNIFGKSKALGEGTMTICGLEFIEQHNITYKNLFKICGRYVLNEQFDYSIYDNEFIITKKINDAVCTFIYKLHFKDVNKLLLFLKSQEIQLKMINCMGYELIIKKFTDENINNTKYINCLGMYGWCAVDGSYVAQ